MKKGIIVLLITVLAAGMAFAGLTGSADVKANLDLNAIKAKKSALALANDSEISVEFGIADLAVAPEALEEGAEAPAVSVDFAAAFTFKVDGEGETTAEAKISKAAIKGANWSVSILGSADAFNYASMYGYNAKSNYEKNPGITATYDGFTLGLGYAEKGTWNISLESKSFEVIDGLTIQAGVGYAAKVAAPEYGYKFTADGLKQYKKDFKTNADGSYSSEATGEYEYVYYTYDAEGKRVKNTETRKIAEDQANLDAAKAKEKAAKKAYQADPSEANYIAYSNAAYKAYLAQLRLNSTVTGVKTKYYDTYTYQYIDEDGLVQTKRVWGDLVGIAGITEYANIGDDAVSEFSASVKAAYASDMLNGGIAADLIFDTVAKKAVVDAKANASFMGAGLDVYYSNLGTVKVDGDDKDVNHVLNAEFSFDVNKFVELPVTVSGKVGMENIIGKDAGNGIRVLKASLNAGYGAFGLTGSITYGTVDKKLALSGEFSYAHEIATIKVGGSVKTVKVVEGVGDASKKVAKNQVGMYVSAENTTLIPGATLGLAWNAADLTSVNAKEDNKIGIITASCGIEF